MSKSSSLRLSSHLHLHRSCPFHPFAAGKRLTGEAGKAGLHFLRFAEGEKAGLVGEKKIEDSTQEIRIARPGAQLIDRKAGKGEEIAQKVVIRRDMAKGADGQQFGLVSRHNQDFPKIAPQGSGMDTQT